MGLLIPITVGAALVYFLYGLAQFILVSGDEKKLAEGKQKMVWGVIALFIMVSIWGIIGFLQKDILGSTPPGTLRVQVNN